MNAPISSIREVRRPTDQDIPDSATRLIELQTGQIQAMDGIDPNDLPIIQKDKSLKLLTAPGLATAAKRLPGSAVEEPSVVVISTEELQSLIFTLGTGLSRLESDALRLYLEGSSYEDMAAELGCDTKTIDNALQRVKRKILTHQQSREVMQ